MIVTVPLEVQGANALCGSTAIGYPGMPAFLGFANAFRRNAADMIGPSQVRSVAVVHHNGRLRAAGRYGDRLTHKRAVHDSSDKSPRSFFSTPTEVQPQIDLSCTIMIEMDMRPEAIEVTEAEAVRREALSPLDAHVPTRAFGGRAVLQGRAIAHHDREEAIRRTKPGWLVVDRTTELGDGAMDPMDALVWRCRRPDRSNPGPDDDRIGRIPMHVGYVGIGPGARRAGSRDADTDHFFAEPITGLALFVRKYEAAADEYRTAFWVPKIDRDSRMFTLKAGA